MTRTLWLSAPTQVPLTTVSFINWKQLKCKSLGIMKQLYRCNQTNGKVSGVHTPSLLDHFYAPDNSVSVQQLSLIKYSCCRVSYFNRTTLVTKQSLCTSASLLHSQELGNGKKNRLIRTDINPGCNVVAFPTINKHYGSASRPLSGLEPYCAGHCTDTDKRIPVLKGLQSRSQNGVEDRDITYK